MNFPGQKTFLEIFYEFTSHLTIKIGRENQSSNCCIGGWRDKSLLTFCQGLCRQQAEHLCLVILSRFYCIILRFLSNLEIVKVISGFVQCHFPSLHWQRWLSKLWFSLSCDVLPVWRQYHTKYLVFTIQDESQVLRIILP